MSEKSVGPLEMRILGLLDGNEPRSVADIQNQLAAHGETLAYTTVMTVLKRLHDKGLVDRVKVSRRFLYTAGRWAQVKQGILSKVRRALFNDDRLQPIVSLIEDEELSDEELRTLRNRIDAKLGERQ